MAAEYREITENEEPRVIARELIQDHHGHLASAQIAYLWRIGKWQSKGRLELGKAAKLSGHSKVLAGYDFAIILNLDVWGRLTTKQQAALIDHELSHCGVSLNGAYTMWPHNVEDFTHVVARHGLWTPDLEMLKKAMDGYQQIPMDLSGGSPPSPAPARTMSAILTRENVAKIEQQLNEHMAGTGYEGHISLSVGTPAGSQNAREMADGTQIGQAITAAAIPEGVDPETGEISPSANDPTSARPPVAYRERDGRIIVCRQGLGEKWGSFRGGHRVKSPALPMRQTRAEAEADLVAYAKDKGLERVATGGGPGAEQTPTRVAD